MFIYESNDENIPISAVASQEEIHLEETEEELRVILETDDPPPPRSESPNQQRETPLKNLSPAILMILHSAKRQSRKCLGWLESKDYAGMVFGFKEDGASLDFPRRFTAFSQSLIPAKRDLPRDRL